MTSLALVARLRAQARGFGGLGVAAVLLLLAALSVVLVLVPRQEQALASLRAEADATRVRALRLALTVQPGVASADPAERFREGFPLAASRQPRLAALLDLVSRHGLASTRSEYRYQVEPALGLARYRVALPLAGSYDALRSFIEDALRSDAALSLDSVRLRRADGRAAQVQAELQFSLLMRMEAPAAPVLAELSQ